MSSKPQQAESARPTAQPVGTLVSVNVGMPKDVPWQGKTVFTGVFKDPDPVEPPADGSALIGCSQPRDDVVLDL
jgi:hypothetical protein